MGNNTALQVHTGSPDESKSLAVSRGPVAMLRPIAAPAEVLKAQEETRELVAKTLQQGRDYGVIPGTEKPTMLKPGAERVALSFGCYYGDPEIIEREIDHDRAVAWVKRKAKWEGRGAERRKVGEEETHGTSLGLYRYVVRVPVIARESGAVVGFGIGSCSTMESKYIDRPRDSENTALKMAHKRALVSACLVTFGLSDQFTQDVEDMPHVAGDGTDGAGSVATPPAVCPKCKGAMWDNRATKKTPKAPDYKCKDKACDGAYWPGQWPPPPPPELASDEQKTKIAELLNTADINDAERDKIAKASGNPEKPLKAKRADEIIAHLTKLVPPPPSPELGEMPGELALNAPTTAPTSASTK